MNGRRATALFRYFFPFESKAHPVSPLTVPPFTTVGLTLIMEACDVLYSC